MNMNMNMNMFMYVCMNTERERELKDRRTVEDSITNRMKRNADERDSRTI